jgi:phosphohistidine swiveling domain-containing protein
VVEKSPRNILDVNVSHQGRAMYRKEVAEDEQSRIRGGSEWRDLAESRATSQVLNEEQINELSDIILRIESHYGFPCDIEWAYAGDEVGSAEDTRSDKGQFYIVQSRPITTLTIKVGADNGVVRLLDQGNKEVLPLTKENTVFTFESTGTTFLFEDIVSHHYIQWECIRVAKGDNVRVFVEKNEVKRMHIEGAAMTRSFLEEKVSLMQEQSQYMESHILELKMKGALTQNDLQEFFRPLEVICDGYSFFDIHYSDGMVKGDDFSEAGEYVQSVKNVLRDVLGIPFFTEDGWFRTGLGVLAKQFDLPIETLEWYTKADIEKLFDGERVSGQIIDGGKLASVLYKNKTGLMTWVIGNEALTIFETFQDNNVGVHEVRGTVAHKGTGTIQGIVRVVKKDFSDPSHLLRVAESINQGEILVTDTTDPDFLPIMKKSGAIVTDVGGMLSHASITSRELNKLCVVGTVNASKVFKDGDLVEVDADNGVVRILEKHEEIHVTFTLSYTRDTTLFMQELWAKSLINLPKEKFGWQNPYLPLVAHYENDGVVEIWQNMEALGWFMDKLFEENKKGTEFADALFAEYQRLLERFQDLVEKGLLNKENVNEFKEIASQSVFIITVFIYIGTDERTPENVQKICVKAREMYDLFAESDSYIRKSIEEYAGYNSEIAGVVLAKEFSNIPKKELLQKRLKNFLLIDGEEMYTETLHDFEKDGVNYKFPQENSNHEGELQGQVAFRGHVKGTVKIVRKQGDLEKVEVGDILVSPMTTPDFLPAMKKTAAFVTDEGGITCHAAIVAREMGKPCIIGTKIATEVLKDGDLVEVDAESGIVRIIERD